MALEKMVIIAYTDKSFTSEVKANNRLTVYINPNQYSQSFKLCYNLSQPQGSSGGSPDFNKVRSSVVNFELIFDATGAGPQPPAGSQADFSKGVTPQIDAFKALVFACNGFIHSPNFVKLSWGTLLFKCRLQNLQISYTLFRSDGTPLRAKAVTTFIGYTDEEELARRARRSSPDLSHLVTVEAGDTLPLMCWRIYGNSALYRQVAEINGLAGFRTLPVGARLLFPPMVSSPQ